MVETGIRAWIGSDDLCRSTAFLSPRMIGGESNSNFTSRIPFKPVHLCARVLSTRKGRRVYASKLLGKQLRAIKSVSLISTAS